MIASLRRIRRIIETETAYRLWQLQTLQRLGGNSSGIAWRQLDAGAIALLARRLGPAHNRVLGLRGDLMAEIEPLLAWYADAGIKPQFETISTYADPALAGELVRRGYYQSGFQVVLAAAAALSGQGPGQGSGQERGQQEGADSIEAVDSPGQLAAFLKLHGWAAAEAGRHQPSSRRGAGQVSLYLRRSQGRPVAAAVLFVSDGIGYCVPAAATGNAAAGLDGALLARRIAAARDAGAEWVCTEADLMSVRHLSLTRMGFEAAFLRAQWSSLSGP
jgi:hypothetical protein